VAEKERVTIQNLANFLVSSKVFRNLNIWPFSLGYGTQHYFQKITKNVAQGSG
jgi:hypothetical protein